MSIFFSPQKVNYYEYYDFNHDVPSLDKIQVFVCHSRTGCAIVHSHAVLDYPSLYSFVPRYCRI